MKTYEEYLEDVKQDGLTLELVPEELMTEEIALKL